MALLFRCSKIATHPWMRAGAATVLWTAALCVDVSARTSDHFAPIGPEFIASASTNYNQYWARASVAWDGSFFATSFSSGQDPMARIFALDGTPLTTGLFCTPSLNQHIQDEAECSVATDGRVLVAWSDRYGYDGEQMGIFGRIFESSGVPVTPEFQINEFGQASQWRPLIARHPAGGWVVGWSGDWDGDALFRIVNTDGTFRTGDLRVNTFDNGAQVDTAPGVAPDGTMLMVFVDFSGFSGLGSGTNLWSRLYDPNGVPLQAAPVPFNSPGFRAGEQREPRVASDGLGRFIVVWEDSVADGTGYGVFGRILDPQGVPLTLEFPLHTNFTSSQRAPRVAADQFGNFIVAWEDWTGPDADIRAQRFAPDGTKVGTDFVVHANTIGAQRSPGLSMSHSTGHVVFTFEGPGNSTDVFARIFTTYNEPFAYCTAKLNSLGCEPLISWTGSPTLSGADDFHVSASDVLNNKAGLLFWGYAGGAQPFAGGLLCVQPPVIRTPLQNSLGSASTSDCSGSFDTYFSHAYFAAKGVQVGDTLYAQFWSRDPGFAAPQNVSLSNAIEFDVRP